MENLKLVITDEENQEHIFEFFETTLFKIIVNSENLEKDGIFLTISFLDSNNIFYEKRETYASYALQMSNIKIKSCKIYNLGILIFNSEKFTNIKFKRCIFNNNISNNDDDILFDLHFIKGEGIL